MRLPSPAMVIALIALFSSLGGVSYGLAKGAINGREVKNRSLTGKDVRTGSLGSRVVKESSLGTVPSAGLATQADGVTHFAAVTREGVLGIQRGTLSAAPTSDAGDYRVVFDKDIRSCAHFATIASPAPVDDALRGQIAVGVSTADVRALQVQTTNAQGQPATRPFHVAVLC